MFRFSFLLLFLLLLASGSLSLTPIYDIKYAPGASTGTCDGALGDCRLDSELFTDSEVHRRILGSTATYISYAALTADRVPCSTAGRSYYNCAASGPANPYSRGCTAITKCARDTS